MYQINIFSVFFLFYLMFNPKTSPTHSGVGIMCFVFFLQPEPLRCNGFLTPITNRESPITRSKVFGFQPGTGDIMGANLCNLIYNCILL